MSTRSTIAMEFPDGIVRQISCHWDGYIEHNGLLLLTYYNDSAVLQQLIELGDLSILGRTIGEKHPFENPYRWGTTQFDEWREQYRHVCTFYGRDRGEKDTEAITFHSYEEYVNSSVHFEEYNYIRRNTGEWLVQSYDNLFQPLLDLIKTIDPDDVNV